MRFYLGTHMPNWLGTAGVPLFVSHRRLAGRRTFPRATAPWALDSGGFTELDVHGAWTVSAKDYAAAVQRYSDEIGPMTFAAPQDWMCEPWIIEKTGLSVAEHQRRTTDNFLELRTLAPAMPIAPVLQGWEHADYHAHVEMYDDAGVDLTLEPVVGIGSVCRRQHTDEIGEIVEHVAAYGIQLHGFGVKTIGLAKYGQYLKSSDSMSWSFDGRRSPPLPHCTHKNCANCLDYALLWRDRVLARMEAK